MAENLSDVDQRLVAGLRTVFITENDAERSGADEVGD
jgi:hypothetical protein